MGKSGRDRRDSPSIIERWSGVKRKVSGKKEQRSLCREKEEAREKGKKEESTSLRGKKTWIGRGPRHKKASVFRTARGKRKRQETTCLPTRGTI